jgi:hypothetical protein
MSACPGATLSREMCGAYAPLHRPPLIRRDAPVQYPDTAADPCPG